MAEDRKTALVTGGASGIGFGIAEALTGAGYDVVLIGRREAPLRDAAAKLGPTTNWRTADVARRNEVRAALSEFERIAQTSRAAF
jgi:3-oxoacyl-[acyl-carrier protein] reductase